MAQYIRPGTDSFLTQTRLAVPVGPSYRRLVRKLERDPVREEFQVLFERVSVFGDGLIVGEEEVDYGRKKPTEI
jgi:hypothetical protein